MPKDDGNDDRRKHEEEQAEDKAGERFSARLSRTDGRFCRARDCGGGIRRRWNATESRSTFAAELRSVSGRRTAPVAKDRSPPLKAVEIRTVVIVSRRRCQSCVLQNAGAGCLGDCQRR